MTNFTSEDLIMYYYHEMSPQQAKACRQALESQWFLHEKMQVFTEATQVLNGSLLAPSPKSIQKILSYAGEVAPEYVDN